MSDIKKYTSAVEMQNFWINDIAPNYFDLDNVNNYRAGIFGYVNEVMSNVTMDTHHAINVARREFYPVTAQNPQSIYKMASLQKIGLPMATPATCKAVLLLDRDEVIENSTYKNGVYTCVIDSTAQIIADTIPFVIDYPIIIISKNTNGTWSHTIHYDKSHSNDLVTGYTNYYITNKTVLQDGKRYLLLSVQLRQVSIESISQLVTTDSLIETVSLLYSFEGDIANFEVYYVEEPEVSTPVQLRKLTQGQNIIEQPFCYYRMLNRNLLEISFPKNIYFTPDLNSEVRVDVYTSLGKSGNFPSFNGSLACTLESEAYPYNNNMTMTGVIDGSAFGGKDIPTIEQYTDTVKNVYSTNNVFTTTNDLQIRFDSMSDDDNNRVKVRKKRADAMFREYGAYVLLKDTSGNVVPTNTLTVNMKLEDFDVYNESSQRGFIKPGTIFEYDPASDTAELYTAKKSSDISINDDLSVYDSDNSKFIYTNPFLISATLYPNVVGYYHNAINETRSVEYSYINDNSVMQFIGSNLTFYRNTIDGENFYTFSMNISPTTDLSPETVIEIPTEEDDDYYFRAERNGYVDSVLYSDDAIICTIVYDNGETDTIQVSSTITNDEDGEFTYEPGYSLTVNVYDHFIEDDILAVKKVTDTGKIRACLNFQEILYDDNLYIPMNIEKYDADLNVYTLVGYMSTDDIMDDGAILIEHGIYDATGFEDDNISLKYTDLRTEVNVFYNSDTTNYTHKYSEFEYFKKHTLTNTYMESAEESLSLIQQIAFIKSTMLFSKGEDNEDDNEDEYIITIKEIPLAKANWIKTTANFNYLTQAITSNYKKLRSIYYELENNFEIDMKFYNTYGKSKFFRVGIKSEWEMLNHVNCSFKFGVYLSSIVSQEAFLKQFREYVKKRVEEVNSSAGTGQSIYIMNLIHDIKDNFNEVGYIEYYGFDEYDVRVQKIEPIPTSEMSDELLTNYIPEFINICTYVQDGENVPNVEVVFLDAPE